MSGYITWRGKKVASGWPATLLFIALLYVMFCAIVGISALATYGALTAISLVVR